MKLNWSVAALSIMALLLTGCGNAMRDYIERDTPGETAAVRQDLTMPPDLRLPPPGSAPAPAAPAAYDNSANLAAPATPAPSISQGTVAAAPQDKYAKAGISRVKPDGTQKTDYELDSELRQYYIAQKRQKNPNYGTVMNMGNIFKDE